MKSSQKNSSKPSTKELALGRSLGKFLTSATEFPKRVIGASINSYFVWLPLMISFLHSIRLKNLVAESKRVQSLIW